SALRGEKQPETALVVGVAFTPQQAALFQRAHAARDLRLVAPRALYQVLQAAAGRAMQQAKHADFGGRKGESRRGQDAKELAPVLEDEMFQCMLDINRACARSHSPSPLPLGAPLYEKWLILTTIFRTLRRPPQPLFRVPHARRIS